VSIPHQGSFSKLLGRQECRQGPIHRLWCRRRDREHEGGITEVVLEAIKTSEFLFADLTWEKPNLYYELGHAQARNKRVIHIPEACVVLITERGLKVLPSTEQIGNQYRRRFPEFLDF
jgi:hypothetical protein